MFSASFAVLREHLSSIVVYQTVRPGDYDMTTSNDQPHMTRVPASFLPPIVLDRSKTPIYRQLYNWFRRAITDGQIRPGQRVPSTRSLAAELGISRIPVLNAYEQLHAEGYLETFLGAGTCVG